MATNPFDQFDPTTAKPTANPFDRFDPSSAKLEEAPKRTIGGTIGDIGVTALKGAVGLPQAAAGLASIATGGLAGKGLESIGVRFDDAQKFLDTQYSGAQQEAQKRVQDADGFVGTAKAMLQNPSTIATAAGESIPSMFAGGALARGLGLVNRLGARWGAAVGEGIMGAGSAAEQVRTQTADRELTAGQAGLAALSGVGTAAFGALGGKVAQRMGIGDVDTMIAQGAAKTAGQPARRSTISQMAGGALSEGMLEELPQSLQEQALQNIALGKPWDEGLDKAAAQSLIVGGAMGAAGGGIGSIGNRRELAQEQAAIDRARAAAADAQAKTEQYLRDNPHAGWTAEQGRLTPEMVGPMPQGPQAPDISTTAGAAAPRDGVDFERQVDTSDLSLVDTARADREAAQAARHTTDFTVEDTTPAWSTAAGAAPVRAPGIDVPQEFDTGTLGFEQNLKPSQLMGIDPAEGPLSAAAATAVDSGASNGATADVRPESAGGDRSGRADAGAGMDAGLGSRDGTVSLSQRTGADRAPLGAVASDAGGSAPNPSVARAPLARDGRLTVTPGDDGLLRNARGEPFTKAQARMAAKQNGGGLEPVEVDGGFALAKVEPNSTTALAQSAPSAIDSEAPASTETAPKNEASSAELTRAVPANDAENQSVAGSPANVIASAAGNQAPAPVASDAAAAQVVPAARPAGVEAAGVAPNIEPTNSLARTASWVIREKATGAVVMETFDRKKVDALNTAKYEAVPVEQHLASINATPLSERAQNKTTERASQIARNLGEPIQKSPLNAKRKAERLRQEAERVEAVAAKQDNLPDIQRSNLEAAKMLRNAADSVEATPAARSFQSQSAGLPEQQGVAGRTLSDVAEARGQKPMFSRRAEPTLASTLDTIRAAGVQIDASERGDVVTLSRIVVPQDRRSQGAGTKAMQALVDYSDATGKHLALSPSADFGGNKARLTAFYKRFGFVENKGRSRAFSTSHTMYRQAPGKVMFGRSSATQQAYEARIDALFNGAKANLEGARVLDRSDVLGLLGMGEKPLFLAEGKVISGQQTHPRMTAEVWKKVPGWIEDPAAVFKSDTDGGLVFIAPEAIGGAPVSIIVRPDAGKPNTLRAHVLLNAYDRSSATPFTRWINDGLLQFADSKKFPALFETTSGRRLPGTALQNKPGTQRILTEKNLAGWRRENNPALSRSGSAKTLGNANPRAQYEAEWVANVERAAAAIKAGWKNAPDVVVIAGMQDEKVPEAVRRADAAQRSQGAQGQPEGFFYNGKVYLVATELPMVRDVARVMFHETLGHFGLRGVFGDALNKQLNLLALNRRADVIRQAREYGLHGLSDKAVNTASDAEVWASMTQQHRMHAAEEVLAFLAQEQPSLSLVQRAVAVIRTWLRENIPSLAMGDMTDAEVVNRFIIPARNWVERGRQSRVDGMPAFGRATNQPMATNNVAGQDQGGAPAGDNMGAPMTLFHGGKAVLSSLDGRGRKNRFLYTTPTEAMAKEYGQHVTRFVPAKDARIADLSDPEALYGSQAAVEAIQQYAQENDIDPDDLVAAVADGRAWETYGEYMQDDINDVVGAALGADIVALPDSTFASNPQVQGKTFVVLDKSKVKITNEPSASGGSGAMFSRAATAQPGQQTQTAPSQPGAKWAMPEPSRFDSAVYKMQDKHIDTLRVIQEIEKTGKAIAEDQNIRLQEELYHGRSAKRVNDFAENELKPVLEYMRGAGLKIADVDEYLHARHAREANALIAAREPSMPDGGSGMTNAAADAYMKALPADQRAKLEKAAEGVDAIIAGTRDLYVAYGLESQAVTDGWKAQFKHYVPLMREDKDGGMGIGQGFSIKGKEVKGRTGSTRKVVDIFSNIAMQRERVIVRGEKNRVAQAAVKLAEANPNTDFWTVDKVPTTRDHDPKTNTVVEQADTMFKQRENVLVAKFVQPDGSVIERAVVFDPDNERAVRMAGALKNLDAQQLEGMLAASAKVTRYFAAVNTQWNPVFGVVNIVRDVQGALVNLQSTPLAGQQATIAKHTASALMGIYADLRAARGGKKGNSQWAQLFEQFQQDGGQTGYRDQFATSADRAEAMERVLNPEAWAKSGLGRVISAGGTLTAPMEQVRKTLAPVFNWLTDYNDSMENAVRLAAYKTALDRGISRQQAASIAKNLTVNFNRKGQVATQAGALYAFFNAAMQGSARIGQALFTMDGGDVKTIRLSKTGKQVVLGGVLLGGLQALALAAAGFDDEDPPEFVRERSLIIPIGGKNYVTIPMPLGLHVIPGLGRHAMEFALSGGKDPAKRLISMAGMFADAFNPIGNAGLSMQTLAPTVLDPLAALTENKDFTGKDIARKSMNKAMPGHMQGKDTSTWLGKMIAEGINYLSGGNQYRAGVFSPTPDQIDYLAAQVGGGVWRELSKVEQTATTAASGEELAPYKVPLLGRFYGNAKSQASQATAFYAGVDRLNALETEIKNMRKDGRWMEAGQLMRSRPDAPLIDVANSAERRVQELRRQKRELVRRGAERDAVRAKEEQITQVMQRFNETAARLTS